MALIVKEALTLDITQAVCANGVQALLLVAHPLQTSAALDNLGIPRYRASGRGSSGARCASATHEVRRRQAPRGVGYTSSPRARVITSSSLSGLAGWWDRHNGVAT
jgi:hypothetical protein